MTRGRRWFFCSGVTLTSERRRLNGRCIQGPLGQSCSVVSDSVKMCKYRSAMFPFIGCFIFLFFFTTTNRASPPESKVSRPSVALTRSSRSDSAAVALTERIQNKSVQVLRLQGQRIVNTTEVKVACETGALWELA